MLEAGIVSPSSSLWSSPVVIVPKRDGTQRICIDYRKINQVLVKDSHPLPRIDDIFATLGNSKYFSTLDLKSGYHQISVAPKDREKQLSVPEHHFMSLTDCLLVWPVGQESL